MKPVGGEAPAGVAAVATASASGARAATRPQGWRKRALHTGQHRLYSPRWSGGNGPHPRPRRSGVCYAAVREEGRGRHPRPATSRLATLPGSVTTPAPWINQRLIRSRWNFRKQRERSARRAGRGTPAPAVARWLEQHLAVARHDTGRRLDQAVVLERADIPRGHGHARPLKQLERQLARLAPAGALAIEAEVAVLGNRRSPGPLRMPA